MLTNRTLARINDRPRATSRLPLLVVGGGVLVLAALLYAFGLLPPLAALGVVGGGVLLGLFLYASQKGLGVWRRVAGSLLCEQGEDECIPSL